MKILYYGNLGNTGLRLSTWLRSRGHDVTLCVYDDQKHERSLPEWQDPSLKDNYPDWIIKTKRDELWEFLPGNQIVRSAKACDIVIVTGNEIVPALTLNKPVVFKPVGGDLTVVPFQYQTAKHCLLSATYRKRIHKVKSILAGQADSFWAARLLGVSDKFIPYSLPVDVDEIRNNIDNSYYKEISEQYSSYDFVLFNPTRKNLDPRSIEYKGNEKVLSAVKRFINKTDYKIRFVTGLHGHDTDQYVERVKQLGMEEHTSYVEHLPLPKLHAFFALPNCIVLDHFGEIDVGALGGIARESLSFGAPLIIANDTESWHFKRLYRENCPIYSAFSTDAIYDALVQISELSPEQRHTFRSQVQQWAYQALHWENNIQLLESHLFDVFENAKKEGQ